MFDWQESLQRYLAEVGRVEANIWLNRLADSALRAIWRAPDIVELCPWGEPAGTAALEVAIERMGQDALGFIILESPIY